MNATTYGLDIAKGVFQLYCVDTQTGEIANRKFGRDDLIEFLAAYSTQTEQPFRGKPSKHSTRNRAGIPQQSERGGHGDAG